MRSDAVSPTLPQHVESSGDIVSLSDVHFAWPGEDGFALDVETFDLSRGTSTLLLGASGSGKSTLLSLIAGIAAPDRGTITIADTDLTRLSARERDRFRAEHLGVVFQMFNLLPYGSVIDNVLLPLSFAPKRAAKVENPVEEARRLLFALGFDDDLISKQTGRLSVGQQQRVAAARALIGGPDLIIADEPTSALDRDRRKSFLDLVFALVQEAGATLLMVSHDDGLSPQFDETHQLSDLVDVRLQ